MVQCIFDEEETGLPGFLCFQLEKKVAQLEDSLAKADKEYYDASRKAEAARQDWESMVFKARRLLLSVIVIVTIVVTITVVVTITEVVTITVVVTVTVFITSQNPISHVNFTAPPPLTRCSATFRSRLKNFSSYPVPILLLRHHTTTITFDFHHCTMLSTS